MKNLFFSLIAALLLVGCSDNDEPEIYYTEKQQKALSVFNGTWADTQFSNLSEAEGSHLLPNPDKIIFGIQNSNPIEIYENDYMNGETLLFSSFGELIYHSEGYEDVPCYYWISKNADELRLYRKETKKLYNKYGLSVKSETKMNLQDSNITLPYIFIKQ